jgi:hypothetical protein
MSRAVALAVAPLLAGLSLTSRAPGSVIDNYSTNDSSNYNFVNLYNDSSGTIANRFAVSSTGGGGSTTVFQPTYHSGATEGFIWNQGQSLTNVGDTVSIQIYFNNMTNNTDLGLVLDPTEAPANSTNATQVYLEDSNAGGYTYKLGIQGASSASLVLTTSSSPAPSGFVTLTVDINANNQITASINDSGLTSGTITTGSLTVAQSTSNPLYFGPLIYTVAGTVSQLQETNLSFASAPEPSSLGLIAIAFTGLFCRWRTRVEKTERLSRNSLSKDTPLAEWRLGEVR